MLGTPKKMWRNLSAAATCCIFEPGFDGFDLHRVGGIEDVEFGEALDFAEGQTKDFRAEAGATHAEKKRVLELGFFYIGSDFLEDVELRELLFGDVQPAEPIAFVVAGPKGGVALQEAAHLVIFFPIRDGGLNQSVQLFGEEVKLAVEAHACTPAVLPVASNN